MDTVAPTPPLAAASQAPTAYDDPTAHDDEALTKVDPNYKTALRISVALSCVPVVIGALVLESVIVEAADGAWPVPYGVLVGLVVFLALAVIIRLPGRRWNARGYNMSVDRLRVVKGILWRSDTVVPFGRVQHIDVDQGPIERALDIATMTLHTAGSHNASVTLPGLNQERAREMREEIRQKIKRDSL